MKNAFFILAVLALLIFSGCAKKTGTAGQGIYEEERIAALGSPTYKEISAGGFRILPFPGLDYNGLRDGKQAFYASNKDSTFAIYTDTGVTGDEKSFEETMQIYKDLYKEYSPSCSEVSTEGWVTEARAFSCRYFVSGYEIDYKSTVFYREGSHVETILGVWGRSLGEYEYIFDAFTAKAVKWD